MPRLSNELEKIKQEQIKSGYLTCNKCKEKRELCLFYKQKKEELIYYKTHKCKVCYTKKVYNEKKIKRFKRFKPEDSIEVSNDCKLFLKRVKKQSGYLDPVDVYRLANHHINVFGFSERLFPNLKTELNIMLEELNSL